MNASVLGEARRKKLDFEGAVAAGVFSRIGEGCIDFEAFFRFLSESQYSGWVVVEQDVIYGQTAAHPVESMRASLDYLKTLISKVESSVSIAKQKA